MFVTTTDDIQIHCESAGEGSIALVCTHGWMGHGEWWDSVRDAFSPSYEVITMDLAGHGRSGTRANGSAQGYADDILAVAATARAPRIVLVGHSMSGAYATLAAASVNRLVGLILVDTLKNLDQTPTLEQVAPVLAAYRTDYANAVTSSLSKYLFSPGTPKAVSDMLTKRFLGVDGSVAADLLEPLYLNDYRPAASAVKVPVRGIGGDLNPGSVEANRKYFADYDAMDLAGCGHYPMLEQPEAFNTAMRWALKSI
ncbi:MAG TPA: alpha/beta hydrolase [Kofleriaceae bacterium]